MKANKQRIIENLCYTELVYKRINKKLATDFSKEEIEVLIDEVLKKTNEKYYFKTGKNYYVTNTENQIRITINSNTFRVITVDKIKE
jgi:stress-induced morphogen